MSSEATNPSNESMSDRLDAIREEMRLALSEEIESRESEVCLVAASKTQSTNKIIEAYQNGVRDFGENYVHEIVAKSNDPQILEMCPDIQWHFIGHLQTNKAIRLINCPNIYMLHCVDSAKLAKLLHKEWLKVPAREGPLNVMIQVNTSNEKSKNGVSMEEVDELAKYILGNCRRLDLRGFMTIGSPNYNVELGPNPEYQMLVDIRDRLESIYEFKSFELSMGMSKDFVHAIQIGSSYVRIGERIFGERQKKKK